MIAGLVGPLMTAVLGCDSIDAWSDIDGSVSTFNWGGAATSQVVVLESGQHEFGDEWFLTAEPGERGIDLSLLLSIVIAAATAILFGGPVVDELTLAGGGLIGGGELIARMFSENRRSPSEVIQALSEFGSRHDAD